MSSTKGISRKTTAMLIIIAMLVSAFSIMGMTAEEAHAAAKAKKPAKVTGFKVTQKSETVTASWKKAKKVKVGKKKYAVKYQLETTVVDVFGTKGTQKATYTGTKKSYTSHPGTKFTFRVRAFYTDKNGKKVYGKWTAKKSQTIKNTMSIRVQSARVADNDSRILAQVETWGAKNAKYDTAVFEFNGQTKKCGKYDHVMFNDAKGGTIKAYAQYTVKNSKGKTKVIKTKTATATVAPAGNGTSATNPTSGGGDTPTDPTKPTGGGTIVKEDTTRTYVKSGTTTELHGAGSVAAATATNPYILKDYTAIGDEEYYDFFPFENTPSGRANNKFIVRFTKDVQTKYDWYFYPANNKALVSALNLTGNNAPVFNGMLADSNKNKVVMKTNWQCIDGYIVGFDKSTKKEVYCKKLGWTTQCHYGIYAPGDVSINGPYFKKCQDVFKIVYKNSKITEKDSSRKKAQRIRDYLDDKTTYELNDNSLNDLLNIGFFRNRDPQWNGKSSYLNPDSFDYSTVLNLMLGIEGASCQSFQLLESFVARQIDSGASLDHADFSGMAYNHEAIYVMFSDGTDLTLDMSDTMYGSLSSVGTAKDMFYTTNWRDYVTEALGNEACNLWFGF